MNSSPEIAAVLGRIPSGLFILTARGPEGRETGMLASWVQQASFDPPQVTVAVNRKRYLNDWLTPGSSVALNLVGETQKSFLSHFGKGFEPDEPAFQGLALVRTPGGLPTLATALGWLEGQVRSTIDAGDHRIYLLEITQAGSGENLTTERPYVHIRKNGLGY